MLQLLLNNIFVYILLLEGVTGTIRDIHYRYVSALHSKELFQYMSLGIGLIITLHTLTPSQPIWSPLEGQQQKSNFCQLKGLNPHIAPGFQEVLSNMEEHLRVGSTNHNLLRNEWRNLRFC